MAFLVASAAFLWLLVEWQRGPSNATFAVAVVAASVAATVLGFAAATYTGVVAHELGHAMAAVALTPGRPLIEIGKAPRRLRLSIGRIDAHLGIRPGQAHCVCPSPRLPRSRQLAIYAAGPFASATFAGLWFWISAHAGRLGHLAAIVGVIELMHAIGNLVPRRFERPDDHGRPRTLFSDGAHIRAVLRNRPLLEPAAPPAPISLRTGPRGRAVVNAMVQLARAEESRGVDTQHLLRALVTADTRTREILRARGWSAEVGELPSGVAAPPPPTPALRRILDATRALLPASGHAAAEPEHLLLALLRTGESNALAALKAAGVDIGGLRSDLVAALRGQVTTRTSNG